eukprot:CAMPEP_0116899878 /NCGR_PEP_ID=MMETSP0467-20121206/8352_1 /TAXON_ID=283647 /ORGANISM="Mesodinium pulex, Strain SPMC105" /LENGTH=44 /DNA_ID= /DNA_START= /DNA_END= /DNA_ORIENTATION=
MVFHTAWRHAYLGGSEEGIAYFETKTRDIDKTLNYMVEEDNREE